MMQDILVASKDYAELDEFFSKCNARTILLVCDNSMRFLKLNDYFLSLEERIGIHVVKFSNFEPNPQYDSVCSGIEKYHAGQCDMIVAVGGGSAIDVAKCIKLFCYMNNDENYLHQEIKPNDIPFMAIPTTAGTGSEATRFAVIYYKGEKQSISHESCIPSTVLFDSSTLKTLPLYQKKATMLDALCHAIESFWSVNSTDESMEYSQMAIRMILANVDGYLSNDEEANYNMLKAANIAGKAINITQTTAGHAMCYKITSLYGIAHGHAAALVNRKLWRWMLDNTERVTDSRGSRHLKTVLGKIAEAMDCNTAKDAVDKFECLFNKLELSVPKVNDAELEVLKKSVNPVRLKNNPIQPDIQDVENLYREILDYTPGGNNYES